MTDQQIQELQSALQGQSLLLQQLQEAYANDLERYLKLDGWREIAQASTDRFTVSGIKDIAQLARVMRLANPLIFRGVDIQKLYTFAQGVQISAKDEDINEILQAFLDDEKNQKALFSHESMLQREQDLQTDGNLFFMFFVNQMTGFTRFCYVHMQEIQQIVTNPDNSNDKWYYLRQWQVDNIDNTIETKQAYYPDINYNPVAQPETINGITVKWENPIYHISTNTYNSHWGICEFYASIAWGIAYKKFLENLATLWRALSRFAFKAKVQGGSSALTATQNLFNTTISSTQGETNPPPVTGSILAMQEGNDFEPMKVSGATMKAEDGRQFKMMAIMPFGFPETFFSDADVGNNATAQSLQRPSELKVVSRQKLWSNIFNTLINFSLWNYYSLSNAPFATAGYKPDGNDRTKTIDYSDDIDPSINIEWPPINPEDMQAKITSIIDTITLRGQLPAIPQLLPELMRVLLNALGITEIDEIMTDVFPNGEQQDIETEEAIKRMAEAMVRYDTFANIERE